MPQIVSRLSSVYVFALVANRSDAEGLGVLTLATAISAAPIGLATAIVGKPLAGLTDPDQRRSRATMAYSAAVVVGVAMAAVLVCLALLTDGLVRVALFGGALGVPSAMVVECTYWRSVFLDGPRRASVTLAGAYAAQALLFTAAFATTSGDALILAPFAALCVVAAVFVVVYRGISLRAAREWLTTLRPSWLPYLFGVAASLVFIQAVPALLAATAGFAAASVYRAGELAFGGTNLLIGVTMQALLTEGATRPVRVHARATLVLLTVAGLNALAVFLLPEALLRAVVGPAADDLRNLLYLVAIQRGALAASNVGNVLLVPRLSPRRFAVMDIVAAGSSLTLLLVGASLDGLRGGLAGLALAEVALALLYSRVLRRVA